MVNVLNADMRREKGKEARRLGYVPGTIYGHKIESGLDIKIKRGEISTFLKNNTVGSKVRVKVDGNEYTCVIRDIQYAPAGTEPLHIDIYSTSEDKVERARIPLVFRGQEQLTNRRLILNTVMQEVQLRGKVKDLPEFIEIDVSSLEPNGNIKVEDINLPSDVELLSEPDEVVVTVLEVRAEADESDEADESNATIGSLV